ncbi:MAG: 2-dehydropantoate 2-reductase [Alphaproteobacteria bacterium]|nr:2-dehydropantoate 2-reductase [Alphaproteobacteria bacterium]
MKICIFGAGAIGAAVGAQLHRAGSDVTLIARGAHLAAMREKGLTVIRGDDRITVSPPCTDDPAAAGPQDLVIVTVKAHTAPAIVDMMQPLLGPETAVVTAMNGIPWWYFHGLSVPGGAHWLESVDPGGVQWRGIGPQRAIGGVVYTAGEVVEPGVIAQGQRSRIDIGEPDGTLSPRCRVLAEALTAAGIEAPVRRRIRDDIWLKLWGNLSFNPVSVLTHGTLRGMAADDGVRAVLRGMMTEARAVGEAFGVGFEMDVEARIEMAADVGHHRSSMLQDLLQERSMEIGPIVTAVQEMARLADIPTPTIDMVLALVKHRAATAKGTA